MTPDEILKAFDNIRVWRQGDRRAPHKPLLILMALGNLARGEKPRAEFAEIEGKLGRLLEEFGPSGSNTTRHLPFWHLATDKLWQLDGPQEIIARPPGAAPTIGELRANHVSGGFPPEIELAFQKNPALAAEVARRVLDAHFPESIRQDVLDAVGLSLEPADAGGGDSAARRRDPAFREKVLLAYEYLHFDAKYRVDNLAGVFGEQESGDNDDVSEAKAAGTVKNVDLYKMHTYNDAIRRSIGSYVIYPGDAPENQSGENCFRHYLEIVPGIGAFALKPRAEDGMEPLGLNVMLQFISDVLAHQLSKFTQSYRISFWTESTLRDLVPGYEARLVDFAFDAKPPKDTQVVLGFVRDDESAQSCYDTKAFYCHAVEWDKSIPRSADGAGTSGNPTYLDFDPFRADLLVVYHNRRSVPWIAKVAEVKLISAEERAAEVGRVLKDMNAAYYYRFQLTDFQPARTRNVSTIVQRRPGKPIACSLSDFASCP